MPVTTLLDAIKFFSDEATCVEFVRDQRWPDGVICPRCDSDNVAWVASRMVWQCKACRPRKQFSVKVGTIFEDSPIPLSKWLPAVWLLASAKNGISSYELAKAVGVTQKSAWFMLHRIRLAMQAGGFDKPMAGQAEVDETFIGRLAQNMHKDKRAVKITGTGGAGKETVFGLLERHGPDGHSVVRVDHVTSRRRNVAPGSEVFSDALGSYRDLASDFAHGVIHHAEKYVEGQIHTNGIENFWSLLKRATRDTYVSVEPFHLFRYLDEEAFRFNTRKVPDSDRMAMVVSRVSGRRLTYGQLTGTFGPS